MGSIISCLAVGIGIERRGKMITMRKLKQMIKIKRRTYKLATPSSPDEEMTVTPLKPSWQI